ncbi:MAG: TIGR03905 family TSCPD domain-containing protein [Clostridia bacterium]
MKYTTHGTCSREIQFDVADGKVVNVSFVGGCNGNLQGIGKLVEGLPVEQVIEKLKGIRCGRNVTSCPDQLSKALTEYLAKE